MRRVREVPEDLGPAVLAHVPSPDRPGHGTGRRAASAEQCRGEPAPAVHRQLGPCSRSTWTQTWSAPAAKCSSTPGADRRLVAPRRRSRRRAGRSRRRRSRRRPSRAGAGCSRSSAARGTSPWCAAAIARAFAGSVSSTAICSGMSHASGPITSRAIAVCSTGTKYGCAPMARSAASASIFGPSAASARTGSCAAGRGEVRRGVHPVEVLAHRGERRSVLVLAQALDRGLVAHAEPEQEAVGERVGERLPDRRHRDRVAAVDRGDAGRDDEPLGAAEEQRRVHERVAAGHLGDPERVVAELLELRGDLGHRRRSAAGRGAGPDPDASELHRRHSGSPGSAAGPAACWNPNENLF